MPEALRRNELRRLVRLKRVGKHGPSLFYKMKKSAVVVLLTQTLNCKTDIVFVDIHINSQQEFSFQCEGFVIKERKKVYFLSKLTGLAQL